MSVKNGYIFIDLSNPDDDSSQVYGKKKQEALEDMVQEEELTDEGNADSPLFHALVFQKGKVFHSALGMNYSGIMSNDVLREYRHSHDEDDSDDEKEPPKIEDRIVLCCKDEKLGALFGETCQRWAIRLGESELAARPKLPYGQIKLSTPFAEWNARGKEVKDDPEKLRQQHAMYRAFRGFMRNHANPPIPLSKNKGVSCDQFLGYSLKSAMIERIFPKEQLDKILAKLMEIEAVKKDNGYKKLRQIPLKHFEDFEKLVNECFAEAKENKEFHIPNRSKYFDYLSTPVKYSSIDHFGQRVLHNPEIFEFKGYFCILKDGDKMTPGVLDHDLYLKLIQPKPEEREEGEEEEVKAHSVFISQAELDQLVERPQRMTTAELIDKGIASHVSHPVSESEGVNRKAAEESKSASLIPSAEPDISLTHDEEAETKDKSKRADI